MTVADTIDYATLLQVDITAIVGTFIFLTVVGLARTQYELQQKKAWWILTSFLVISFAISRAAILIEDIWATNDIIKTVREQVDIPRIFALAGFLYILMVFIGIMRLMWPKKKSS